MTRTASSERVGELEVELEQTREILLSAAREEQRLKGVLAQLEAARDCIAAKLDAQCKTATSLEQVSDPCACRASLCHATASSTCD